MNLLHSIDYKNKIVYTRLKSLNPNELHVKELILKNTSGQEFIKRYRAKDGFLYSVFKSNLH